MQHTVCAHAMVSTSMQSRFFFFTLCTICTIRLNFSGFLKKSETDDVWVRACMCVYVCLVLGSVLKLKPCGAPCLDVCRRFTGDNCINKQSWPARLTKSESPQLPPSFLDWCAQHYLGILRTNNLQHEGLELWETTTGELERCFFWSC